jgi:hypothetical protein
MSEIDEVFVLAIRERADGAVHVESLLSGARRRGIRRRRVRRAASGLAVTVLVLAGAGTAALTPWWESATPNVVRGPTETPRASGSSGVVPLSQVRPPLASGALAVDAGGGVGGDRHLLHLDVNDPAGLGMLGWRSGPGWESLSVSRSGSADAFNQYEVYVAESETALAEAYQGEVLPGKPTTEQVTIGGRPAMLRLSGDLGPGTGRYATIQWHPTDRVVAKIIVDFGNGPGSTAAGDRDGILRVAGWVRLHRVFRCVVEFRLTWTPPGTRVVTCGLDLRAEGAAVSVDSTVECQSGNGRFLVATSGAHPALHPNAEAGGRQVETGNGSVRYEYGGRLVTVEPDGTDPIGDVDVLHVVAGFDPSKSSDPGSWPADPLA